MASFELVGVATCSKQMASLALYLAKRRPVTFPKKNVRFAAPLYILDQLHLRLDRTALRVAWLLDGSSSV